MPDTYKIEVEYTDTFGGEANYSWVRRAELEIPRGTSRREIMRRAKASVGLTGMRGRSCNNGDSWEFKPFGYATIMMARVLY